MRAVRRDGSGPADADMKHLLLAAGGGAIGAAARYLVNITCAAFLPPTFPFATFGINVLGSFLMGVVVASSVPLFGGSAAWRIFLATGILGGLTTFSAFSLETWQLIERDEIVLALIYSAGSVVAGLAALVAGLSLTRAVLA